MSAPHTAPGPWQAIRSIPAEGIDGWWINAQPHAALRGFTHNLAWVNGGEENEATARLIAAAPDLLAALVACKHGAEYPDELGDIMDAAIAKATGEPK